MLKSSCRFGSKLAKTIYMNNLLNLPTFIITNDLIGSGLAFRSTLTQQFTFSTFVLRFTKSTCIMACAGSASFSEKSFKFTNRLAQEKSPYLLQHAHNPVDWYPWCDEAIKKARRENKLIFLSVGYSTCHWCHVMQHESFENEEVAELMNRHFVNIKVDREERPDIDRIYMQFVLMINGNGGWPMSVWLTPDLAPITAGTYFPPETRWGTPDFSTVIKTIANKWETKRDELISTGLHVVKTLKKSTSERSGESELKENFCEHQLHKTNRILNQRFDREYGGFGSHPKFPEVPRLNLILHSYAITKMDNILQMALHTLDCIGRGGIHDHIFGGFARYSVDRQWHVPHFEKMLYDQAQLMVVYSNAYKLTRNQEFLDYSDGIFRYITSNLQHPLGGFYAGEDADSFPQKGDTKTIEGAFYAWDYTEVKKIIESSKEVLLQFKSDVGDMERLFEIYSYHFDIKVNGNVLPTSDPHGHLTSKNIFIVRGSLQKTSEKFGIEKSKLKELISTINGLLYNVRCQRPRPHLDTKILCCWNGLILSGISKLASCDIDSQRKESYLNAAKKLKQFIYENLYDKHIRKLKRSCYGVSTRDSTLVQSPKSHVIEGFLDDYAFLIRGLLDYYETTCDVASLSWAEELQDVQNSLFWDNEKHGYFYSQAESPNVLIRLKDEHDGAEPCGNSASARNLIFLEYYLKKSNYSAMIKQLFQYFGDQNSLGLTLPEMLSALLLYENNFDVIVVLSDNTEKNEHFLTLCRKYFIPALIIQQQHTNVDKMRVNDDKVKVTVNELPTVFVCHQRVCQGPTNDENELEKILNRNFFGKSF